jgi:putative hydrolase of the HAD superfamily
VVFHRKRSFPPEAFKDFMFAQSVALPGMLELARGLKAAHGLKVVVVSNEGRELNAYRIGAFSLEAFVDTFVSSCFVHLRKPDPEIFRLALDLAQASTTQVVYIENTPMFAEVATGLGIRSILHKNCATTRAELASLGLSEAG